MTVGWRLVLDPGARRTDGGRVLIGGSPLRILRLSPAGAAWLDAVAGGEPVPPGATSERLARRLVDAGIAHPRPPAGAAPFTPADVAVVIPVRHDDAGLARTRAALGDVGEVVVVTDDGAQPRGPAAARNLGWRRTERPVVAFVDADVEPAPGWLDALLAHLADGAVGAVAPRVRSRPDGAPDWLARYDATRSSLDLGAVPATVRPGSRVPYVPTAALVVRRDALDAVGGFDEALFVGEDVDLVWRLHGAGWAVRYEPAATATHPCRPTLGAWIGQRYRYGTSAAALAARHGDAVAPLGISGWSALAWGAVVAGHPAAGAGVAAATTAALVPKLRGLEHPGREALRIAGLGNLWAGRSVADALRRPWWPLALALGVLHRRARPALLAAVVAPSLLEPLPDSAARQIRAGALRLLDDLAYGAGVWAGAARARSARALLPRFSGPVDPPLAT